MKTKSILIRISYVIILLTSCHSIALASDILSSINTSSNDAIYEKINNDIDSDNDGVIDSQDNCPNTGLNLVVDNQGCPIATSCPLPLVPKLRVFFLENSSDIQSQYYSELDKLAKLMHKYSKIPILIEGHASTIEITSDNNDISLRRAITVKKYLVTEQNIDPDNIVIIAYGIERPIAPNDTIEGRAVNQRVYATFDNRADMAELEYRQNSQ